MIVSPILEENSWSVINAVAENHLGRKYWKVGDTKEFSVKYRGSYDVKIIAEIIGFDHDDLADGTGKAGITFDTKCIFGNRGETQTMAYAYNEVLAYGNVRDRYFGSSIDRTLKILEEDIPEPLKTYIKKVSKKQRIITNFTSAEGILESEYGFGEANLFALCMKEMGLRDPWDVNDIGEKYEYYLQTENTDIGVSSTSQSNMAAYGGSRLKGFVNEAGVWDRTYYFLRDISSYKQNDVNYLCFKGINGVSGSLYNIDTDPWYLVFGFCL